jgi:hypothetical protein
MDGIFLHHQFPPAKPLSKQPPHNLSISAIEIKTASDNSIVEISIVFILSF